MSTHLRSGKNKVQYGKAVAFSFKFQLRFMIKVIHKTPTPFHPLVVLGLNSQDMKMVGKRRRVCILTLAPGNRPLKGALLKDTRALTLSGKPWFSREGFLRGRDPTVSSEASSGCFSRYKSWKQRQSSRFRTWA